MISPETIARIEAMMAEASVFEDERLRPRLEQEGCGLVGGDSVMRTQRSVDFPRPCWIGPAPGPDSKAVVAFHGEHVFGVEFAVSHGHDGEDEGFLPQHGGPANRLRP